MVRYRLLKLLMGAVAEARKRRIGRKMRVRCLHLLCMRLSRCLVMVIVLLNDLLFVCVMLKRRLLVMVWVMPRLLVCVIVCRSVVTRNLLKRY